MKRRIDSPQGQALDGKRIAIVEPVCGHLRNFMLRGRSKADVQWKRFCLAQQYIEIARITAMRSKRQGRHVTCRFSLPIPVGSTNGVLRMTCDAGCVRSCSLKKDFFYSVNV
jgi:hypothetical protein